MTIQRLLLSSFWCVGVLAACGGPEGFGEEEALSLSTYEAAEQNAPADDDGWPMQGTQLHGSLLTSASFSGAVLNGVPIENLHLEEGELVGEVRYTLTQTTSSLRECEILQTGSTRSCGFKSMGVGTCTPGTSVTLGGGACSLGTCTGNPVVRVCSGTAPCEHTSTSRLVSGDNACSSYCPLVQFTCPSSGTYNVLAGPYLVGASWSMALVPTNGQLPGKQVVRGKALQGAILEAQVDGVSTTVRIEEVVSAAAVQTSSGKSWDASGETFLYRLVRPLAVGGYEDVCHSNEDNANWRWAVPMSGVFDSVSGARSDNEPGRFTFGCDSGVIAKCYRWGYKPWLPTQDAAKPEMMKRLHESCTRMARADYCGNGKPFTVNGTPIHPWDTLPQPIRPLAEGLSTPLFEAGWDHTGAVCLSKTRWEHLQPLPESCPLVAPGWIVPGGEGVQCPPGQRWDSALDKPCATVCNSAEEAKAYKQSLNLFNESEYNLAP